eukprot:3874583-Pleurochrysis_carterae.AAC.1
MSTCAHAYPLLVAVGSLHWIDAQQVWRRTRARPAGRSPRRAAASCALGALPPTPRCRAAKTGRIRVLRGRRSRTRGSRVRASARLAARPPCASF